MKLNAKYVTFSLIAIASTYVLYHNERFLADSNHPAWQHYAPFKWWLLPHAVFGAIVLLFAPAYASDLFLMLMVPGGLIMTGWLLVKGVNVPKWNANLNAGAL